MAFGLVSLEKRLKENIKNYSLDQIYRMDEVTELLKMFAAHTGCCFLLTDRHGEKMVSAGGGFANETMDMDAKPGEKIQVAGRTIAHLYMKPGDLDEKQAQKLLAVIRSHLITLGESAYNGMETSLYADELENLLEKEQFRTVHGEKHDALTGVLNHTYFDSRMQVIDRSGVVPVAIINVNINDWKYVNDHFGDEESDRLIKVVAGFLKDEAKPEYIIGRCGGDSFLVLIPMAEEGEAEEFCVQVQEACMSYADEKLAP
ncbi:MAG: GGDEF domain-containing protein, partial [Lachnospiraceae bacterium]|nr:GGDEF domain-containing protein [Lachnospiraceae bacterium]